MFYQLKPTFEAVQEKPAEGVPWVEVITQQEMDSQVTQHPYLARSLRHGHSCKAELFDHCAAGALLVPRKEHSPRSGHSFAFLLTADHLTFVDDTGQIEVLLEQLSYQPGLGASPGELLLEFLELLIQEDAAFLQHLETQLDKLEDVRDIKELKPDRSVYRELMMVKVRASAQDRQAISAISNIFRATIVDVGRDSLTVMLTGDQSKLDALINLLEDYEILELARTGLTGLERGSEDIRYLP